MLTSELFSRQIHSYSGTLFKQGTFGQSPIENWNTLQVSGLRWENCLLYRNQAKPYSNPVNIIIGMLLILVTFSLKSGDTLCATCFDGSHSLHQVLLTSVCYVVNAVEIKVTCSSAQNLQQMLDDLYINYVIRECLIRLIDFKKVILISYCVFMMTSLLI